MSIVYDMQVGILRHIERRAEIITIFLAWFFSSGPMPIANLAAGLKALWNPLLVVLPELLWGCIFAYCGWSTVTESTLLFHVRSEEI
jgi:hypothetical protein